MLWVVREKGKVFHRIPKSACTECKNDEGEKNQMTAAFISKGEIEQKKRRKGGEEKNRHLSPDRSESMRESFIGEKFRCEHHEKNDEEKCIARDMRIVFKRAEACEKQSPCLTKEKEESCEEKSADNRIENGVWRVVMPEILISDEIVFDERKTKRLSEGSKEISVVHLG